MKSVSTVQEMHENAVNANGHNSVAMLQKHVETYARNEMEIERIRSRMKDDLDKAKKEGFKKGGIKGAVKQLRMTEEQRQAKLEVQRDIDETTMLCKDLPLFKQAA